MNKALLLIPKYSRYQALNFFLDRLGESFSRIDIANEQVDLGKVSFMDFLKQVRAFQPTFTVCFNGVVPDPYIGSLPEYTGVPHLCWLVDPPPTFAPLASEPQMIIGCNDQHSVEVFQALGAPHPFLLPHAVHRELAEAPPVPKEIDLVLLGTFIDPRAIKRQWEKEHPPQVAAAMERWAELSLEDPSRALHQILCDELNCSIEQLFEREVLWEEIQRYARGIERIRLVDALSDCDLHVIGDGWESYLQENHPNLPRRPALAYTDSLELTRRARILISSNPQFRNGSHDRLFSGLAARTAVLTNRNPWVDQEFPESCGVFTYVSGSISAVRDQVSDLLAAYPEQAIETGRQCVMQRHLWDHRATMVAKKRALI